MTRAALYTAEQHEREHLCFTTQRDGDRLVVEVTSRLIATNAYDLRNRVSIAIEDGAKFVAIDLARADDVDSRGFGALLSIARAAVKRGGSCTIVNAQPDVRALFDHHHIVSQFTFATSEADAPAPLREGDRVAFAHDTSRSYRVVRIGDGSMISGGLPLVEIDGFSGEFGQHVFVRVATSEVTP